MGRWKVTTDHARDAGAAPARAVSWRAGRHGGRQAGHRGRAAAAQIAAERDGLQATLVAERQRAITAAAEQQNRIAALEAALTRPDEDLNVAEARARTAETAREQALAAAETARAETGQVRTELAGQIAELRAELVRRRDVLVIGESVRARARRLAFSAASGGGARLQVAAPAEGGRAMSCI
ncbi:hypothetical protein [Streptosporangium canum]|uniref:hypothetical protein n=1 Tax=Streptosporangium canum TaxID=324952 RepID=UPI0037B6FB16